MTEDRIVKVEIDDDGKLCVYPETQDFAFIYRAGTEVGWDPQRRCLLSPKPREWSHARWFTKIVATSADEYGVELQLTLQTDWINVPNDVRLEIMTEQAARGANLT